mmetsp:Transcript_10379/g.21629  ORF Transcript_10379/g.21629 Transcript_10379/m.21629 type:complete len:142 (+) Transcript_10379:1014-1439(+)
MNACMHERVSLLTTTQLKTAHSAFFSKEDTSAIVAEENIRFTNGYRMPEEIDQSIDQMVTRVFSWRLSSLPCRPPTFFLYMTLCVCLRRAHGHNPPAWLLFSSRTLEKVLMSFLIAISSLGKPLKGQIVYRQDGGGNRSRS